MIDDLKKSFEIRTAKIDEDFNITIEAAPNDLGGYVWAITMTKGMIEYFEEQKSKDASLNIRNTMKLTACSALIADIMRDAVTKYELLKYYYSISESLVGNFKMVHEEGTGQKPTDSVKIEVDE